MSCLPSELASPPSSKLTRAQPQVDALCLCMTLKVMLLSVTLNKQLLPLFCTEPTGVDSQLFSGLSFFVMHHNGNRAQSKHSF